MTQWHRWDTDEGLVSGPGSCCLNCAQWDDDVDLDSECVGPIGGEYNDDEETP